jgi:hypothetical protein
MHAEWSRGEVGTMEMELQRLQSRLSALELKRDKLQALSSSCQRRKAALVAEEQEHRAHVAKMEQQLAKEYDEVFQFSCCAQCVTCGIVPILTHPRPPLLHRWGRPWQSSRVLWCRYSRISRGSSVTATTARKMFGPLLHKRPVPLSALLPCPRRPLRCTRLLWTNTRCSKRVSQGR